MCSTYFRVEQSAVGSTTRNGPIVRATLGRHDLKVPIGQTGLGRGFYRKCAQLSRAEGFQTIIRDLYGYRMVHAAVISNPKSNGPVLCGFTSIVNPTVRFGFVVFFTGLFCAVFTNRKTYGAGRCGLQILLILRCGSVL